MKALVTALVTLWVSHADAHCYSIWNYPQPQNCGTKGIHARTTRPRTVVLSSVPSPPIRVRDDGPDIPIPDLSADWGGTLETELELSLQRQKAIRQLTVGNK